MTTYDYIIAGGGTAGCVLAARLSASENARVLLIEEGPAEKLPEQDIAPAWPLLLSTPLNRGEFSVPQAATGRRTFLPRARALGGGGAINGMGFTRGHRSGYDAWPEQGAKGWGFDDLLPYFRRSEHTEGRDPLVRGVDGPVRVGPADPLNPAVAACLEAAYEIGYRQATDINSGLEEGFGPIDINFHAGVRQSSAATYLTPEVLARPNLDVVAGALAHRLLIEKGRCVGVEYSVHEADPVTAGCSGEVVVTAGAVGSPQLLMLSGIGPAAHLREFGIDVVADLPGVGSNFHDHPLSAIVYGAARDVPPGQFGHGEGIGLVRSDPALAAPDLQILLVDVAQVPQEDGYGAAPGHGGYTIRPAVIRPKSRGTVRLASAVPGASPLIDPNYLSDDQDLRTMVAGLRIAREIGRAKALDDWRGSELVPGPDTDNEDELRAYALRSVDSYCHQVGTCKIGSDESAVVDAELRVSGVAGLRVADSSVMPSIPSGNTNAAVFAIAERAAELLLG